MQVQVIFNNDDIRCAVKLPNGDEKEFWQVSAMLNWCRENGYEPVLAEGGVVL